MSRWHLMGVLGIVAGLGLSASAQIEMTWSLAHKRTVLMEPIRATVSIVNHTGENLDLTPNGNARLGFDVEDQPTSFVAETGHPLVRRAIIIPAGETREVEVNLLNAYRIIKGQSYMLRPILEFGGMRFRGPRLSLEVQPGLELLARNYGMPGSGEARSVSLRQIHRGRYDRLFFRIDDADTGWCYGTYELGRVIRFFVPRLERDRDGVFHVLHQSAPDRFVQSRFGDDGTPLGMSYYLAETGNIRLERDAEGRIAVVGATPFEQDPARPGVLTAPSLPPANPYSGQIGELPPKGRVRPSPAAPSPRHSSPVQRSTPAEDIVTW